MYIIASTRQPTMASLSTNLVTQQQQNKTAKMNRRHFNELQTI